MIHPIPPVHATITRNTLALAGAQVANLALPLVTLPYLLRVLGVDQFGVYGFCQAVLASAVVLADYGFNLSATQRIAGVQGQPEAINRIFWSVQAAKLILALTALLLLGLVVWFVPAFRAVWPVMLASSPVVLGSVLFPQWLFHGLERMGYVTICTIAAKASAIPLIFWAVQSAQDTWLAALIQASGQVIAGLLACGLIRRHRLIGWVSPNWRDVRQAFIHGWHIFLSSAAISFYTNTNAVLLGLLTNHTAVGLFSAADKIRLACQSLVAPLSTAVYPRVSALMAQNPTAGLALVRKLLLVQGGLTFGLSCGLWLAAPWIVRLVMGEQFDAAVSVLRVLSPLPFLIGLSNVFGIQTMLPLGMKKSFSRIVMASGLVNMILMLMLAPRWEAGGAAAAVLFTEGLVTLAMVLVLRRSKVRLFGTHNPSSIKHEI